MNDKMTWAQKKKQLMRGTRVRLPSGADGVFITFVMGNDKLCRVAMGDHTGKITVADTASVLKATFGDQ